MARIARKLTRLSKIEIENARKKIARFLPGSKEDRKFYARDRSDRSSMLQMPAWKLKLKLDEENRKYLHFLWSENMWLSYFLLRFIKQISNCLKYLPEIGADSRFSFIMFGKCLVSLEIAPWSLKIFLCLKCSTIFPLKIARIEKFNAQNWYFCCSVSTQVMVRTMFYVHLFKTKNRAFEFDYQIINIFKYVWCSKTIFESVQKNTMNV